MLKWRKKKEKLEKNLIQPTTIWLEKIYNLNTKSTVNQIFSHANEFFTVKNREEVFMT